MKAQQAASALSLFLSCLLARSRSSSLVLHLSRVTYAAGNSTPDHSNHLHFSFFLSVFEGVPALVFLICLDS